MRSSPPDIRAALIESLFAPIASLIVGAVACSIIGVAVALRVGNEWIMANSIAIFAVGMLRVASAVLYRNYKKAASTATPPSCGSASTKPAPGLSPACSACCAG